MNLFKTFPLIVAMLFVFGCSSAQKKTETAQAAPAKATAEKTATAAKTAEGAVECSLKSDQRKIEIKSENKGCEVMYTKFGKTSSVASGHEGKAHCEKVVEHMKKKLEASGYKCQ